MRTLIFSLLVVAGPPFGGWPHGATDAIHAEAQPASVVLTPLAGDGQLIRLPALGFALSVKPRCTGRGKPSSLSISVADTRLHFSASDLADAAVVEAMLNLPQEQLAPVRIDGFCRIGNEEGPPGFVLEDAYTARLSLRCGPDDKQTIVYATLPLDIDLSCRREDTAPDQDPASPESPVSF